MEFCLQPPDSFTICLHGQPILIHKPSKPLFHVGKCQSSYNMHLGHFVIKHEIQTKISLQIENINQIKESQVYEILFVDENKFYNFPLKFFINNNKIQIEFPRTATLNYIESIIEGEELIKRDENSPYDNDETNLWFSLESLPFNEEIIRGCGLQFGINDLRRKILPIWVSEWYHEQLYLNDNQNFQPSLNTTYHPQPMFSSSRGYTFCAYGSAYAQFDFSNETSHNFHFANIPYRLEITLIGRSIDYNFDPILPEWLYNGIILGVQGGTEIVDKKLCKMSEYGTCVAGIWAQDWCGKRITSFGKRVFWNWQWNENFYPNLKEKIVEWQHNYNDCRFLAYINPYIADDGSLFKEANENNYLVKRFDCENTVYLIDFGEFNGGIVDLTNPKAFQWYKKVIQTNLIDIGISGWMADFGEYLPCDVRLYVNISGSLIHNIWPILWARCNYEAIRDVGKLNEITFFMRSGYLNIQRYCSLFWTGDQSVDLSDNTGLSAGIRSCLSLSLSDILCIHIDIGGYFTRINGRTRQVILRWCEMSTFNIVMRTHEGNRPDLNIQFDSDIICLKFFGRMSKIHYHLKPYFHNVIQKASEQKKSSIIPHIEYQYFIGDDLLIAPVIHNDVDKWKVLIPDGEWIHIWTKNIFHKNQYEIIDAPIGYPPVFYRSTTQWKAIFQELKDF